jgi:hypothetical protein
MSLDNRWANCDERSDCLLHDGTGQLAADQS